MLPLLPAKFIWASETCRKQFYGEFPIRTIARSILSDLSITPLCYGPKTCTLMGHLISQVYYESSEEGVPIFHALLKCELRSGVSYKPLFDTIWKICFQYKVILHRAHIPSAPDPQEIAELLPLQRVQQEYFLGNYVKIHNIYQPFQAWLSEMESLLQHHHLFSHNFNDLSIELKSRLGNLAVPPDEETCRAIGRVIMAFRDKSDLSSYIVIGLLFHERSNILPKHFFDTVWGEIDLKFTFSYAYPEKLEQLFELPRVQNTPELFSALDHCIAKEIRYLKAEELMERFGPYLSHCPEINRAVVEMNGGDTSKLPVAYTPEVEERERGDEIEPPLPHVATTISWSRQMLVQFRRNYRFNGSFTHLEQMVLSHLREKRYQLPEDSYIDMGRLISEIDKNRKKHLIISILEDELTGNYEPAGFVKIWEHMIMLNVIFYPHSYDEYPANMEKFLAIPRVQNNPPLVKVFDDYLSKLDKFPRLEVALERYAPYLHLCPGLHAKVNELLHQFRYENNDALLEKYGRFFTTLEVTADVDDFIKSMAKFAPQITHVKLGHHDYSLLNDIMLFKNLISLEIQGSRQRPSPKFLNALKQLLGQNPKLKEFACKLSWVDDEFGPTIAELKELTRLDLSGSGVTEAIGPHLEPLKKLQHLNLRDTKVKGIAITQPELEEIFFTIN